jgi:hypothetical protein
LEEQARPGRIRALLNAGEFREIAARAVKIGLRRMRV